MENSIFVPTTEMGASALEIGKTRKEEILSYSAQSVPVHSKQCTNSHKSFFYLLLFLLHSGSPLVDNDVVVGVASFLVNDCGSSFPDFYTRVSTYDTWIQRQVCDSSDNPPANCDTIGDGEGGGLLECITNICNSILGLVGLGE
jgi:hypothetical protein